MQSWLSVNLHLLGTYLSLSPLITTDWQSTTVLISPCFNSQQQMSMEQSVHSGAFSGRLVCLIWPPPAFFTFLEFLTFLSSINKDRSSHYYVWTTSLPPLLFLVLVPRKECSTPTISKQHPQPSLTYCKASFMSFCTHLPTLCPCHGKHHAAHGYND